MIPPSHALPETLRQAKRWDLVKRTYVSAGLCEGCAARAAWGHQHHGNSWRDLQPPCVRCRGLVEEFHEATSAVAWRKMRQPQTARKTQRLHGTVHRGVDASQPEFGAEGEVAS